MNTEPKGRKTKRAALSLAFAATLIGSLFSTSPASAATPMQIYVEDMQPGVNYGNTYDAAPNETSWGNAAITQAYADAIVAKGYKSIRMTVTWRDHIGPGPSYTIDPAWMTKIQQAVDISLGAGLYVVLNAHHDSGWVSDYGWDPVGVKAKFDALWLQVATQFKDYPDTLSFESINEPGFRGSNNGSDLPDAQMAILLDEVNTNFVQLVRATGGNNATRPLVLPTVYTRGDQPMLDSLKTTITKLNDPNLIATIHYYGWYPFSVNLAGFTTFDETSIYWVHTPFDAAYDTFVAAGIPVIVGEFSVLAGGTIQRGEQLKYHEYVQAYGRSKAMTMMLWDTGGIHSRTSGDWNNRDLGEIMMQAAVGRAITAESDMLFVKAGTPVQDTVVNLKLNGNTLVSVDDNGTILTPTTDYKISGDTLILKKHVLAKYATGAFGEKATLKLNASAGPAWKIFVRYFDTPVPGAMTAVTGGPISIPVAFKGDLLATMEAKYSTGGNVGGTSWTSFQPFGGDFEPNYANNTITLKESFLHDAPANSTANLSFYFWSGKVVTYQLQIAPATSVGSTDLVVYGDSLASGWSASGGWGGWEWFEINPANTTTVHSGTASLSAAPWGWNGLMLTNNTPTDTSAYNTLVFWINGGPTGGQNLGLTIVPSGNWDIPRSAVNIRPLANTWQKFEISLAALGVQGRADLDHIYFQDWSGSDAPTFYVDDIKLTTAYPSTAMVVSGTPNVPTPFSITRSGFSLNRRTNRMVQTVTVKNMSANTVTGPIYLSLDALSSNTTLTNAYDVAPTDRPYVQVSAGALAPQASVKVTLEFTVPAAGGITYDARIPTNGLSP